MLQLITPDLNLTRILDLKADDVHRLGLDGLLLDVDGTLKDFTAGEFSEAIIAWVEKLRAAGIRLCLLSNGKKHRIEPLARKLGVPFVAKALKPLPFGCWAAVRQLGLTRKRTAVIGDQIFADVLAGRLAGLFTIRVPPTSLEEPWFTRLKRPLERWVLRRMPLRGLSRAAVSS
jgi:HAD superfamily phosphatase (TIGR01668 family)